MSKEFTIRFAVRFRDIDVLGHVNNASYFTYMESARTEFWLKVFGGKDLYDLNFIVVHAECDFKKPAHFGDHIEVGLRTSSIGKSSFVWDYEIKNSESSELFAVGKTIQVFYDHKEKKSKPVPPEVREKLISW